MALLSEGRVVKVGSSPEVRRLTQPSLPLEAAAALSAENAQRIVRLLEIVPDVAIAVTEVGQLVTAVSTVVTEVTDLLELYTDLAVQEHSDQW